MEKSKYIWYNGKFVPWEKATTHVLSHGLHYGSGIFEGIRAYSNKKDTYIFRLKEHYDRFYNSAKVAFIKLPYTQKTLEEATIKLLKKNDLKDCYIRPLAFIGEGAIGINPGSNKVNIIIAAFKFPSILRLSEFFIYFFKKFTFFLFLIFLADEFKNFFGIFSFSSILKKHG